ncbi:MAG: hypothetical protein ACRYFX_10725 [Janthinobacterium lividum]
MPTVLPSWFRPQLATLLLGLASLPTHAQTAPAGAAYTGPRFPGGPDSLRLALQRLAKTPDAPATGELFIRLELDKAGRSRDMTPLNPPPGPQAVRLNKKQARALDAELAKWPAWQLPASSSPAGPVTMTVPVAFGAAASSAALAYGDTDPIFSASSLGLRPQQPVGHQELMSFLQRQFRYPADDLRARREGQAFGYFEVSEQGKIEQRRIVGSLSLTTDAELLRVLRQLPDARTPAFYQGHPVRVFCLVPITLHIQ